MKKADLNILMLEDEALDVDLIREQLLLLEEYNCIVQWVTDKKSYLKSLQSGTPDIILSDYKLPQYNGLNALNDLRARNLFIPFIFVTGTMDEETAVGTIKAGAWDYVVKDRLFRLPLAIRSALQLKEERTNAAKAEAKNRQLSMAIEQSPVHIVISNTDHKIEYVNAKFSEVTGFAPEEVIGKDMAMLIPDDSKEDYFNSLMNNLREEKKWQGEIQSIKKDGSLFWESVSISPLKNNKGEITHFIAAKEDITQRKMMEKELIEARDKAERSDQLKDAFLQNLSHEIRTPLNAIVGFSDLLNNNKEKALETINEYASIIRNSSDKLLSIVSNLLTIASIQTGQEAVVFKPVNLNALVDYLSEVYLPLARIKKIKLSFYKDITGQKSMIISDETKLIQILSNILNNAVKFTHAGSVDFKYVVQDKIIEFIVRDTGIGIPKESQELIFERFRQADPSVSINYGGTGLGLSISRAFAQMLGGTILLDSEPGVGSTFILSIPYLSEKIKAAPEKRKQPVLTDSVLKILIAEDEINNYQLLKAILRGNNITLFHAGNGYEALKICKEDPSIDLVLMDIKMPAMDGITAFKEIRKIRKYLPVIALTAYTLVQEKQQFFDLGFSEYIAKPINREELLEKINKTIMIPT